jgi:hypothetical protein
MPITKNGIGISILLHLAAASGCNKGVKQANKNENRAFSLQLQLLPKPVR